MLRRRRNEKGLHQVRAALDAASAARTKSQKRKALDSVNAALEEVERLSDPIDVEFAALVAGNPNWSTARARHLGDLLSIQQTRLEKELT